MTVRTADVVVVGTGIMGAATLRSLARAGVDAIGLEQFEVGHARGSSHGASRIFRLSYPEAKYVARARDARARWRELEAELGTELITITGGLDFGKTLDDHVHALVSCGADHELLSGSDVMDRWAFAAVPPDERVLFQPDAGVIRAEAAWRGLVTSAVAKGAELFERTRAVSLAARVDRVRVDTTDGVFEAASVVVTAGPWARPLLEPLGISLDVTPTRETVAFFALEEALRVPSIVEWRDPIVYALASPDPLGVKVGLHHAGPVTDPDEEGQPSQDVVEVVSAWVRQTFPSADPVPVAVDTCIYTNTDDEEFILAREGNIVVGSPCSGHGFKFAPLVGAELAALAIGSPPTPGPSAAPDPPAAA